MMKSILKFALLPLFALATEQIRGISWFGFETEHRGLMCDWSGKNTDWYLEKLQHIGFNSVRLPFSMDYVRAGDFAKMDEFFQAVQKTNLTVLLDFHRVHDSFQSAKPWIEGETTIDDWLQTWDIIIQRYENVSNIIGLDIFNEPQSSNAPEWNSIARQGVSYLEKKYGHHQWLYFIEGVSWGGNDHDVDLDDMPCRDRIIYTVHKYAFTTKGNYQNDWEWSIGNHPANRTNIGEFGFISDAPREVAWATEFLAWLKMKNIRSSYFWCLSPNSGDTGGIFLDDCVKIDCRKVHMLQGFWREQP